MRSDELERRLQERLGALWSAPRAELPAEIDSPIIDLHEVARRVFELALLEEREAQLPADCVRWFIVD